MADHPFVTYKSLSFDEEEMLERSRSFFEYMNKRRSVRDFSDKPVSEEIIENAIKVANTAPSGANKQPWTYCVVSDPKVKKKIRELAEQEEYESYNSRMSEQWLKDLEPIGTDYHKPFLEIAPYLIIVFKKIFDVGREGEKETNYYVNESVGISVGMLLTAIHQVGLVALTHTPSPMNFLQEVLGRPTNERAFLLIPVGYPAENAQIPNLKRKELEDILVYYRSQKTGH